MPRRGLPQTARMRHDLHYVEALAASSGAPVGRMIPIAQVYPNPDQPRQSMGDISELMASISEKGIIEPIIVRQIRGKFQIIAGERRYQAAVQIGIQEVPVVIRDVDDGEVLEIALIENIQRKDLTAFEEASALQVFAERGDCTHEEIARRLGKSRTSVTESMSLDSMPEEVKNLCRLSDITSKSTLLQIVRQGKAEKMIALVEKLTREGVLTRERARKVSRPKSKSFKPYTYKYTAPSKIFNLKLSFKKAKVNKEELVNALESILFDLKNEKS